MSRREFASEQLQPENFVFTEENKRKIKKLILKYPENRLGSALLPLLDLAQRQHEGWLPKVAISHVANLLDVVEIKAFEVASFYTMFNLAPRGKFLVQLCRTTPCWLRGSDDLRKACMDYLEIGIGETTPDGLFTVIEVECLGACISGPAIQINDDFFEDLNVVSFLGILRALRNGESVGIESQTMQHTLPKPKTD